MTGRVLVYISPDADTDTTVRRLEAAGMSVDSVLRTLHVITGAAADAMALRLVPGVTAVEPDRAVTAAAQSSPELAAELAQRVADNRGRGGQRGRHRAETAL